jgi:hypothetical protein
MKRRILIMKELSYVITDPEGIHARPEHLLRRQLHLQVRLLLVKTVKK